MTRGTSGWGGPGDDRSAPGSAGGNFSRDHLFHPAGECTAVLGRRCTPEQKIPSSPELGIKKKRNKKSLRRSLKNASLLQSRYFGSSRTSTMIWRTRVFPRFAPVAWLNNVCAFAGCHDNKTEQRLLSRSSIFGANVVCGSFVILKHDSKER